MAELWKPVIGFEGLYEVSSVGEVRRKNGCLLKQFVNKKKHTNYRYVNLRKDGKPVRASVHRLVAKAFIPNPFQMEMVNHKDENGENNSVENLEWCDRSYNAKYGSSYEKIIKSLVGRISEKRKAVNQFDKNGVFLRSYASESEAAAAVGGAQSNISSACKKAYGKKTAYGYIWEYSEEANFCG